MGIIETDELTHIYMKDTPFETVAISHITLSIDTGEVVSIVGPTGCGKTTLVQHFNGLLRPSTGKVIVDSVDITAKDADMRELRRKVGLVFQYPEHQLFEETVFDDVAFGPRNLGFSAEEIRDNVRESLEFMDLPFERIRQRSPFSLSGGEMRRVALAGVLAMKPKVLVLDEPTAGLDPESRKKLLRKIKELQKTGNTTIVIVSHEIEEIAEISDRITVLKEGHVLIQGGLKTVFSSPELLQSAGVLLPQYTNLMVELRKMGKNVREDVFTLEDAFEEAVRLIKEG